MLLPCLDARLQAALDLFIPGETGADIAADHGHLACALLDRGICRRMVITDISADSLMKAQALAARHQLLDRAVFRVADGFSALKREDGIHCAALCGIGGGLMARLIRTADPDLLPPALVLSCHTDLPMVRETLMNCAWHITGEALVRAKNRFYVVLRAQRGKAAYSPAELLMGPVLLRERPPLLADYLRWRVGVESCKANGAEAVALIRKELSDENAACFRGL